MSIFVSSEIASIFYSSLLSVRSRLMHDGRINNKEFCYCMTDSIKCMDQISNPLTGVRTNIKSIMNRIDCFCLTDSKVVKHSKPSPH